jgi:hypothetical protein
VLGSQIRVTECGDPDSVMVAGEFVALLVTVTLPDTPPAVVGVKTTLRVAVWPAVKVSGGVRPLELKPEPEVVIWEILTLELPVLVSVTDCELVLPKGTFPKLKEAGLAESCRIGATPVPLRGMLVGELEALLTTETLPETLPVTVGANCTLRLPDCPAGSASGKVCPVIVKPAPLTAACETVRLALPELVSVTVCVLLVPTSTSPKATLLGLVLTWPFAGGGGVFWLVIP